MYEAQRIGTFLGRVLIALAILACMVLGSRGNAQTQPSTLTEALSDSQNIGMATYALANIADSTTDWNFTGPLSGKQYHVSVVQRTTFAGGTLFGAVALTHYFPKAKPYVTGGMAIGSAILAGRAYAHTLSHGPGTLPTPAPAAALIRFGR